MGDFDKACEIINDADVVLGLCDDGARHIIKGEEILKFIVASGVSEQLAVTYLPVGRLRRSRQSSACGGRGSSTEGAGQ
jgi:hypothetical protein